MVFRGEMTMTTTTTRPERPKTLHNFTLPSLKWGSQRHLTCTKIESTSSGGSGDHRLRRRSPPLRFSDSSVAIPASGESEHRSRSSNRNSQHRRLRTAPLKSADDGGEEEEEGIEEFRVKIMSDLKTVRDKITQSMYDLGEQDEEQRRTDGSGSGQEEKEVSLVKPWNLRKRRAACKEPAEERIVNPSPPPSRNDPTRVVKERRGAVEAETTAKEMMERPKFSVKLSKKELEEDFMDRSEKARCKVLGFRRF